MSNVSSEAYIKSLMRECQDEVLTLTDFLRGQVVQYPIHNARSQGSVMFGVVKNCTPQGNRFIDFSYIMSGTTLEQSYETTLTLVRDAKITIDEFDRFTQKGACSPESFLLCYVASKIESALERLKQGEGVLIHVETPFGTSEIKQMKDLKAITIEEAQMGFLKAMNSIL